LAGWPSRATLLVDGRMLADMDLGDPTGPVAMYSTAPDEPDWPTGIAAAGAAPAGGGIAPHVQDGVRTAAAVLADAGYAVEETEPPGIDDAAQVALSMFNTPEFRSLLAHLELFEAPTRQFLTEFYDAAGDPDPVTTVTSFMTRHTLLRRWGEFQEACPLILGPICTDIPFKVGTDLGGDAVAKTIHDMRMATAINALGLPAAAVPVGVAGGLPQVIQIIGPRYREDLCLDAATALEDALGIITPIDPR
jgi:amidase